MTIKSRFNARFATAATTRLQRSLLTCRDTSETGRVVNKIADAHFAARVVVMHFAVLIYFRLHIFLICSKNVARFNVQ